MLKGFKKNPCACWIPVVAVTDGHVGRVSCLLGAASAASKIPLQSQQRDAGINQCELCMHATAGKRIPGSGGRRGRRAI